MSLYTRKKGQYVKLTREQVRRLRRTDEVVKLQGASRDCAGMLHAVAGWLSALQVRERKSGAVWLDEGDRAMLKMPCIEIMHKRARGALRAAEALKSV